MIGLEQRVFLCHGKYSAAVDAQPTIWVTFEHTATGDRPAVRVGPRGDVVSGSVTELPGVVVEIGA